MLYLQRSKGDARLHSNRGEDLDRISSVIIVQTLEQRGLDLGPGPLLGKALNFSLSPQFFAEENPGSSGCGMAY